MTRWHSKTRRTKVTMAGAVKFNHVLDDGESIDHEIYWEVHGTEGIYMDFRIKGELFHSVAMTPAVFNTFVQGIAKELKENLDKRTEQQ